MKREDVRRVFPDATDEQVDAILNGFGGELNPVKTERDRARTEAEEASGERDALAAELAALKAEAEDLRRKAEAGMSAEELLAQREAQAAQREREFSLKSNRLDAKAVLSEAGISGDALEALLDRVVTEDPEATAGLARAIAGVRAEAAAAAEQAAKDALLKNGPEPAGAPEAATPATLAEFLKLPYSRQLEIKGSEPGILQRLK